MIRSRENGPCRGGFSFLLPHLPARKRKQEQNRLVLNSVLMYHTLLLYLQRDRADTAKKASYTLFLMVSEDNFIYFFLLGGVSFLYGMGINWKGRERDGKMKKISKKKKVRACIQ